MELYEYRLEVSEHFLQVLALCKHIYAERTRREPSLASVIEYRICKVRKVLDRGPSTLREHLAAMPTSGEIPIAFALSSATGETLARARPAFSAMLGMDLSFGDAISMLLFDYIVEDKADAVIAMLKINTLQ